MDRQNKRLTYIIVTLAIIFIILLAVIFSPKQGTKIYNPEAPSELRATAVSAISVKLAWNDNSKNEDGFIIFRDGEQIASVGPNIEEYIDSGLNYATTYKYEVMAHLFVILKSEGCALTVITLNPPILVRLDKIGVYDCAEENLRDWWIFEGGEIFTTLIVSDNKSEPKTIVKRYKLKDNEITNVNEVIFQTNEVGKKLQIFAIGYENDGGLGEDILYFVADKAIKASLGPSGAILGMSGVDFSDTVAEICGEGDDPLGSFEQVWTKEDNWGINTYPDVSCIKSDGTAGLRIWFTIECPYSRNSTNITLN